jgi:hypothetical protein
LPLQPFVKALHRLQLNYSNATVVVAFLLHHEVVAAAVPQLASQYIMSYFFLAYVA